MASGKWGVASGLMLSISAAFVLLPKRDVILNRGEATVRDLTTVGTADAVERPLYAARIWDDLFHCNGA